MPNAVNVGSGGNRESDLDKILKGLSVARAGLGIASDIRSLTRSTDPTELDIARAGFVKKPLTAQVPGAESKGSVVAGSAPVDTSQASILAKGPQDVEYELYGNTYTNPKMSRDARKDVADLEQKRIDAWSGNKTTLRSSEMLEALRGIEILAAKPGDFGSADIALLTRFMKIIDPGSSVKGDEFRNAETAGGWGKAASLFFNKVKTGQRVDDEVRQDFLNSAKNLMRGQLKVQNTIDETYRGIARDDGLNEDRVVLPIFRDLDKQLTEESKAKPKSSGSSGTNRSPIKDMTREQLLKELNGG